MKLHIVKRYLDKMGVRSADTVEDALRDVAQMLEKVAGKNEAAKPISFFEDRVSLEDAKSVVLKEPPGKTEEVSRS